MSRNFVRFDPAFLRACRIRSYAASNEPFIQIDRRANFFLSFHFSCPAHICPFCKFSPARLPVPPNPDKPEPKLCQNAQVFAVKRIINADSMKLSDIPGGQSSDDSGSLPYLQDDESAQAEKDKSAPPLSGVPG